MVKPSTRDRARALGATARAGGRCRCRRRRLPERAGLAAAVVMPAYGRRVPGVRDSKMLSRAQRERLYPAHSAPGDCRRARRGQRGRDRSAQHLPRHQPGHAPRHLPRGRTTARAHRRAAGLSASRITSALHGDRPRRRAVLLDRGRLDRGQGRSRPPHGSPGGALSALWLGAQRRLRDLDHRRGIEEHGITPSIGARSPASAPSPSGSSSSWSCRRRTSTRCSRRVRRRKRGNPPAIADPVTAAACLRTWRPDGRPASYPRHRRRGGRWRPGSSSGWVCSGARARGLRRRRGRHRGARSGTGPRRRGSSCPPVGQGRRRSESITLERRRVRPASHLGRFAAATRVSHRGLRDRPRQRQPGARPHPGAGGCGGYRTSAPVGRVSRRRCARGARSTRYRGGYRVDTVLIDGRLPLVVGGQHQVAVTLVAAEVVTRADEHRLGRCRAIVDLDPGAEHRVADPVGGGRHQLHDADCAGAADHILPPARLLPGDGKCQGGRNAVRVGFLDDHPAHGVALRDERRHRGRHRGRRGFAAAGARQERTGMVRRWPAKMRLGLRCDWPARWPRP